jgi:hypothetical protein
MMLKREFNFEYIDKLGNDEVDVNWKVTLTVIYLTCMPV